MEMCTIRNDKCRVSKCRGDEIEVSKFSVPKPKCDINAGMKNSAAIQPIITESKISLTGVFLRTAALHTPPVPAAAMQQNFAPNIATSSVNMCSP